jgi:hypothetical protein
MKCCVNWWKYDVSKREEERPGHLIIVYVGCLSVKKVCGCDYYRMMAICVRLHYLISKMKNVNVQERVRMGFDYQSRWAKVIGSEALVFVSSFLLMKSIDRNEMRRSIRMGFDELGKGRRR